MNLPPMTTSESEEKQSSDKETSIANSVECALCAGSVKYFLAKYLVIRNENTMQVVKWQPWPYLLDLLDILCTYQEVDIDKARQLGVTWTVMGYGFWKALFNEVAKNLYLSQGEVEAWELITKSKFIADHIPDYMRKPFDSSSRSQITFKDGYSEVKALPSTEKAGSGYNATLVVRDELYNHPEGEANFSYIAPAIDSGGQLVNLSAVYGDDMTNHFVTRISEFFNKSNTVKKVYPSGLELYTNPDYLSRCLVFLNWKLRPVRLEGLTLDEFRETRLKPRYTQHQLERQYPETIEETLTVAKTASYFEIQALDDMGYDVCPPIKQTEINTFNGIIRIYKPPVKGKRYVVYTDPSDGVGDPFVTGVLDYITGEVVALAMAKDKLFRVSLIHDYLCKTYNDASNSWEANSVGIAFEECIRNLGTKNLIPRRNPKGDILLEKVGIYVEDTMKSKVLFPDLAFAIAHRQIVCHDREFIQQAKLVTRDVDKPVTLKKQTFDWVMCFCGLWQLNKYVPRVKYSMVTVSV